MKEIQINSLTIYQLELGAIRTNCYIVMNRETKDTIIIDPADSEELIFDVVKKYGCNVKGVFLTHGHFDHIYSAVSTARQYHVSLYASKKEKELLANCEMNVSTMINRPIEIEADEWLTDKQNITLGSLSFEVIETSGHTKGSICFYWKEENLLFSGDTLFLESAGRTDFPTGNSSELLDSLRNKLMLLPDETKVFSGHGSSTTIGYERKNNPYIENNFWE